MSYEEDEDTMPPTLSIMLERRLLLDFVSAVRNALREWAEEQEKPTWTLTEIMLQLHDLDKQVEEDDPFPVTWAPPQDIESKGMMDTMWEELSKVRTGVEDEDMGSAKEPNRRTVDEIERGAAPRRRPQTSDPHC